MRGSCIVAAAMGVALLSGCTTIASGVAVAPPGVNRYSFRECLLSRGFYAPAALTGIALRDWHYRHAQPGRKAERPAPSRYDLLEQKDAAFVASAARIIENGLMPGVEYWDARVADQETGDGAHATQAQAPHYDDRGTNLPYVDLSTPRPFPPPASADGAAPPDGGGAPSPGDPRARDWRLNRFLDCYVAPVGLEPPPPAAGGDPTDTVVREDGDDDLEGRLLRGHIVLTLLAQYGTELVISHPGRRQVAQAELLLGHVRDAELALRGASFVMDAEARKAAGDLLTATASGGVPAALKDGKAYAAVAGRIVVDASGSPRPVALEALAVRDVRGSAQPRLGWTGYTTRLLRVLQVGVDIERIDAAQSLDRAANLVSAFAGHGGFGPILKDGLAGVAAVQKIRIYGDAYLRDARETLKVVRVGTSRDAAGAWTYPVPTITAGWTLWDREMERSCQVLAVIAKKEPATGVCIPGAAAEAAK